jgi:hypothetical protein
MPIYRGREGLMAHGFAAKLAANGLPAWCECGKWIVTEIDILKHIMVAVREGGRSWSVLHSYIQELYIDHLEEILDKLEGAANLKFVDDSK